MNHHYRDITDKLGDPKWWDEHAVPRYCDFSPDATANIYAKEVALVLIECQNCRTEFRVCFSTDGMAWLRGEVKLHSLAGDVERGLIHYGDPPNAGCCPAGPTMNSVPRRILEFWAKGDRFEWKRLRKLEHPLDCEWAT